jgi:hypothetical protein
LSVRPLWTPLVDDYGGRLMFDPFKIAHEDLLLSKLDELRARCDCDFKLDVQSDARRNAVVSLTERRTRAEFSCIRPTVAEALAHVLDEALAWCDRETAEVA